MEDGERAGGGQAVVEQRALGFAAQVPDQGNQDDEADLEEDGESDQEGGHGDGPDRALAAEFEEEPVGKRASAAGVFEKPADHGAERDDDGDESERVAEAGLH